MHGLNIRSLQPVPREDSSETRGHIGHPLREDPETQHVVSTQGVLRRSWLILREARQSVLEGMTPDGRRTPLQVKRVQHSSPEVRHPPLPTTTETVRRGTMALTAPRTLVRTQERIALRPRRTGRRHPLVATLMALPLAALLLLVFDGWETVATQASSVGVMLGR
ncbi:hypothetical protein SALBM311S_08416 [Streptomyces alboniger]